MGNDIMHIGPAKTNSMFAFSPCPCTGDQTANAFFGITGRHDGYVRLERLQLPAHVLGRHPTGHGPVGKD